MVQGENPCFDVAPRNQPCDLIILHSDPVHPGFPQLLIKLCQSLLNRGVVRINYGNQFRLGMGIPVAAGSHFYREPLADPLLSASG